MNGRSVSRSDALADTEARPCGTGPVTTGWVSEGSSMCHEAVSVHKHIPPA